MMIIDKNQLKKFETIKKLFLSKTEIPEQANWWSQTNNDIWIKLFTQVIVVGSSTPARRFNKRPDLEQQVSYNKLIEIESQEALELTINQVLRAVGTRYASSDISKCKKAS